MTGVIERKRLSGFERLLWRACRGNIFMKWDEIDEPLTDPRTVRQQKICQTSASNSTLLLQREIVNKVVFVIFFQGDRLKTRVKKICDGYHAKVYPCPSTAAERREVALGVNTRLQDIERVRLSLSHTDRQTDR